MTKKKAAWVTAAAITALGLGSLYSQDFFSFIDQGLAGPILAPLSALLIVLFTGGRLKKLIINEEINGSGEALGRFIMHFTRWVAPVFMGIVLILGTSDRFFPALGSKLSTIPGLIGLIVAAFIAVTLFHRIRQKE